jgi:hypothetical protein
MNWRQFSVAMIQALAWPMVALIALLAYRRRISALLGDGLRRFKAGPLEAEWELVAEEARASIQEVATVVNGGGGPAEGDEVRLNLQKARELAYMPALSASFVRLALEDALTALLPPEEVDRANTMRKLLSAARRLGLIKGGAAIVGERIMTLANQGVHSNPSPAQMVELVDLTEDFLSLFPKQAEHEQLPSRLPSTRPPGERTAARPATSSGP